MRNIHYIPALLLALCTLQGFSQTTTIDGIKYTLDSPEAGEATVSPIDNGGGGYSGQVVIPQTITYNGTEYTVTAIGDNAFKGDDNLTSVSMPLTIERLGDKAFFQCSGIITIRCDALTPPDVLKENSFHKMNASHVTMIVPGQSIELYAAHPYWGLFIYNPANDNITGGNNNQAGDSTVIVTQTRYDILDSQSVFFEKPKNIAGQDNNTSYNEYNFVTYIRNFKNTNWQALYVPIELVYNDWKENFEVAEIHSILETDNGFYAMADYVESKVEPHKLYLIRAKVAGVDTLTVSTPSRTDTDGDPLHKVYTSNTDINGTVPVISTSISFNGESGTTYTFTGQYAATALKETDHTQPPYRYAMTGGELKRPNPENKDGIPLGTFRWWLEATPGINSTANMFSTGRIDYSGNGETSIGNIIIDLNEIEGIDIYYDLSGRRVEEPSNGIYILNGKKIYIE